MTNNTMEYNYGISIRRMVLQKVLCWENALHAPHGKNMTHTNNTKRDHNSAYAQLSTKIAKLEGPTGNSSAPARNTNTVATVIAKTPTLSRSDGYGSTGELVNSCKKLKIL